MSSFLIAEQTANLQGDRMNAAMCHWIHFWNQEFVLLLLRYVLVVL